MILRYGGVSVSAPWPASNLWRRHPMKYVLFALLAVVTTLTACTGGKSEDSSKADSAAE